MKDLKSDVNQSGKNLKRATLGAGCFWGVEETFRNLEGVISTRAGYSGGLTKNPTYEDVCRGNTRHVEVVEIIYDPDKISYTELLDVFWDNHNPTTLNRQGPDIGDQYRSVIFYHDTPQKMDAEKSLQKLEESNRYKDKIVTSIEPAQVFYEAEDYHQQYLKKRGLKSCSYF
ncbi:MAG: peptide-methionine (S)-S-oxide reductase MsrA [Methanobacteriaceae archaeon]|nr:peptide-methionine (S)-S-oxide reductase MsrA [Methanobacteriaceae archaeon]MDZ4172183.1 peptide-methionine (S)-S-oxide reductase MsrA [Methanobacteriaceae archaeon]